MDYLDGSTRNPTGALGHWIDSEVPNDISHLRFMSGYFSVNGLGAFSKIIASINSRGQPITAVIGSNDCETTKDDVEDYLGLVASPRKNVRTAIVSFSGGLFHPKVYHLTRTDGSEFAYVGSANLTPFGVNSGNIEAGIIVDSRKGDTKAVLNQISNSIDSWFGSTAIGASLINTNADVANLVSIGIIGTIKPKRQSSGTGGTNSAVKKPTLSPLLGFGKLSTKTQNTSQATQPTPTTSSAVSAQPSTTTPASVATTYVMTLQKTDVGVGQTSSGTSRRSPEIFIPLSARDADPSFWEWPNGFAQDPTKPKKYDRKGVGMLIGGKIALVNMMTWPDKSDFRLRNEELRSAGNIGDILKIEKLNSPVGYDYNVEVIPQGHAQFAAYSARCTNSVRNSKKIFGYY